MTSPRHRSRWSRASRALRLAARAFALLAALLTAGTGGFRVLRCTESDGCVQLEWVPGSGAATCGGCEVSHDDAAALPEKEPAGALRGSDCGCTDVVIATGTAIRGAATPAVAVVLAISAVPPAFALPPPHVDSIPFGRREWSRRDAVVALSCAPQVRSEVQVA